MERLTERDDQGMVALVCREGCRGGPACFECEQRAARRLAAYEDTGLEPEAVAQLKKIAENFNCDHADPAQLKDLCVKLHELAQAERDGRLVVLPQDDGENTAMYGICENNGEVCKIHVDSVGDPKQLPSILSYLTAALARELGATYHSLLMAMLRYPPVVDMPVNKELAKEAEDGTAQV